MDLLDSTRCIFDEFYQKAKDGDINYFKRLLRKFESRTKKSKFIKQIQKYRHGCLKMSMLHIAAKCLQFEVCKILIDEFKMDVNAIDEANRTPLHCIILHENSITNQMNQVELIEYLINNNVNINARDEHGFTALHYAALTNNLKAATVLLQQENIRVNSVCVKKKCSELGNWFKKYLSKLK